MKFIASIEYSFGGYTLVDSDTIEKVTALVAKTIENQAPLQIVGVKLYETKELPFDVVVTVSPAKLTEVGDGFDDLFKGDNNGL